MAGLTLPEAINQSNNPNLLPYVEIPGKKGSCYFFPGALATNKGMAVLKPILSEKYSNVRVYNSSISTDPFDPDRYKVAAMQFISDINSAKTQKIDVVCHSLGSVDLDLVFREIEKKDPYFFNNKKNREKFRVILIGPTGFFRGVVGAVDYLKRLKDFLSSSDDLGLATLHMIKVAGIEPDMLADSLRLSLPDRVQSIVGQKSFNTLFDGNIPEASSYPLTQREKDTLMTIDQGIHDAIKKKDWIVLRRVLQNRGKLLIPYIEGAFNGEKRKVQKEPFEQLVGLGNVAISLLGMPSIIKSAFFDGAYKRFANLVARGIAIDFILPGFDNVVPASEIEKFMDATGKKGQIVNMGGSTHNSFALRWKEFMIALSKLE